MCSASSQSQDKISATTRNPTYWRRPGSFRPLPAVNVHRIWISLWEKVSAAEILGLDIWGPLVSGPLHLDLKCTVVRVSQLVNDFPKLPLGAMNQSSKSKESKINHKMRDQYGLFIRDSMVPAGAPKLHVALLFELGQSHPGTTF